MDAAVETASGTFLSRLFGWLSKAYEDASEADMIAALDDDTIRRIAGECGIQPEQLLDLAKAGPHAADEMPRMMKALGIDPMEVECRFGAVFRQMQVNCAHCRHKAECRHDLSTGTAAAEFNSYCVNAAELGVLRATPQVLSE
ncbi:BTG family protein [Pseudomonas sp. R2.Fl]|nr:BTG family protein [Pseudomonas sp. R2.Fl]